MATIRVSRTTKPIEPQDGGDRPAMRESTFLHIQGGGDPTIRMIELPAGSVRIGRGAHCEVRLTNEGLGDVQCLLRRRGSTWNFQPVGPPGHVWIDGKPTDSQCPIPLGVPFRVGDHWLTLRPADSATNDWGSFEDPIAVDLDLEPPAPPTSQDDEPEPEPEPEPGLERPRPSPTSDEGAERLRRWEAGSSSASAG